MQNYIVTCTLFALAHRAANGKAPLMHISASPRSKGYAAGIAAYLCWGVLPIYFKLLGPMPAGTVVANRVIWSVVVMALILLATNSLRALRANLSQFSVVRAMFGSALLIGLNWVIYAWAVMNGHILAASLGYFLNPLINVALGVFVLGEHLSRRQVAGIALAALGVVLLAVGSLDMLWISVTLGVSFALYGLIRKTAPVGATQGLAIETFLLAPAAMAYLVYQHSFGQHIFGDSRYIFLLLALGGLVTTVPLILFSVAARSLPLSIVGLLQYIAPSLLFVVGWAVYGEPLSLKTLCSFVLIWVALAMFTYDAWHRYRGEMRSTA